MSTLESKESWRAADVPHEASAGAAAPIYTFSNAIQSPVSQVRKGDLGKKSAESEMEGTWDKVPVYHIVA